MRIEVDNLGQLEIPQDAYYGIQSYRSFLNFQISGTKIHKEFIYGYLMLKKSAAIANEKVNTLSFEKSKAIVNAINLISKENFEKYFIIDTFQAGAGTSQNMNANEVIANYANVNDGGQLGTYHLINPNDDVNMSQSTNDTYPTVMQLSTLELSKKLLRELELIAMAFDTKSHEFEKIIKSGRTHLQDAVPISLGQEFKAYYTIVEQLIANLKLAQNELRILGIGGSAIGTGLNVPSDFKNEILNSLKTIYLDNQLSISDNLCASMQFQYPIINFSNFLRILALDFTKIFNDLRLMSSGPKNGFGEINLPKIQPGSSIMPGKINPSLLEMGNQVCFKVLGNDCAMGFAIQAGQLELNVMMPLMAHLILESCEILTNSIKVIREKCILGITANKENCLNQASRTSEIATLLSPIIGYQKAADLVNESTAKNIHIFELIKAKKILSIEELNKLHIH
jgi:aspartate ammonia-lyase